jgi:hypothetical protein
LYVIDWTLRGQKYRDLILRSLVVPHFDGHLLASRPILMDGNARTHNPYSAVIWLENGYQSIFNIITHDKVNNEYNRLASCTVPENV